MRRYAVPGSTPSRSVDSWRPRSSCAMLYHGLLSQRTACQGPRFNAPPLRRPPPSSSCRRGPERLKRAVKRGASSKVWHQAPHPRRAERARRAGGQAGRARRARRARAGSRGRQRASQAGHRARRRGCCGRGAPSGGCHAQGLQPS